jgi:hypothetical protein
LQVSLGIEEAAEVNGQRYPVPIISASGMAVTMLMAPS